MPLITSMKIRLEIARRHIITYKYTENCTGLIRLRKKMNLSLQIVKKALLNDGDKKNMVSSPLSIAALLNILAFGSSGTTLQQLLNVFGSQNLADLKSSYSKFAAISADAGSSGPLIDFVNGAWVNQLYSIKPSFEHVLKSIFNAETKSLDFVNKPDESKVEINSWVKKSTKGLIDNIDISANSETMIILANVLYFKGDWEVKLNKRWTKDLDFYTANGEKVVVPFMRADEDTVIYYKSFKTFKVAKLPYRNKGGDDTRKFSMNLFLPNERDGLPMLLKEFSENPSLFLSKNLAESVVELDKVLIPKFNFSYQFDVLELMTGLGLNISELTEIIEDHDGNAANIDDVRIMQKARIVVDENGTEAAAITYTELFGCCMYPPKLPSFVADHPFMFMIREDVSGTPFFVGVVLNPLLD